MEHKKIQKISKYFHVLAAFYFLAACLHSIYYDTIALAISYLCCLILMKSLKQSDKYYWKLKNESEELLEVANKQNIQLKTTQLILSIQKTVILELEKAREKKGEVLDGDEWKRKGKS